MRTLFSTLADTARLVHRVPDFSGKLKRAKYVARGLLYPSYTREWFEFLQRPELAIVIRNHPCLYHKLQRPYLNCKLTTRQRLDSLRQHYEFVASHFSPEGIARLYAPSGLGLVSFTLKDLGPFELRLGFSLGEKEGDLAVRLLKSDSGTRLFTMAFSVWKYRNEHAEIFIGGLQGSRFADKDLVVALTRALQGLRPKALLMFAVQQIAMFWRIPSLRAVSDATHIYRHFQKRKALAASYDAFWLDCGATLSADGMFDLPAIFVPRNISEIKVNKRQMYKRRYEMLGGFAEQIQHQLQQTARHTGTT
jgi:uncharacterized protein VirK/YbjX